MNKKFNNIALKREIDLILSDVENIESLFKGDLSDNSIDIIFENPPSTCSFTYYGKEKQRDSDFQLLEDLIYEKI